ncbi:alpha/beta hydrolase family protein [Paenibacillus pabuli]|uniref:alpha/beta hydrolase family protein n=1 Tax=Paenibacillus pabuli TaxID=1472 RepID=UPI0007802C66|nr:prolyl oligopeptidase family serine peptidase [Paenibacillus pabuli]MEC0129154.1 prolyl oligopeptidase family serine peptidase [Paenibacillus pabuli]
MDNCSEQLIAGIPCLWIKPNCHSKGILILYHGWVSNIKDYIFFGSLISDWGYTVILPEIPYHGTRGALNYFDPKEIQKHFWNVVIQTVEEAGDLISELTLYDKIVGVVGNSTGGFAAAGVYSNHISIKSAIIMNGSCAWERFEELICERDGRTPWTSMDKNTILKLDPAKLTGNMKNKAMLILHGTEDTTIPIDSQKYFMKVIEQNNEINKSVQFVEYSKVNHHITLSMLEESKRWLDEQTHN